MWDTSCKDWQERLLAGKSLVPDLPLFDAPAQKALRIFKRLRIPDVEGTPRMEEACGEWVYPILMALFGSYNPETRERMIAEYFILIGKGNSKTSYFAAIMLVAIIMNERPNAEFHLIAPSLKIADYAYSQIDNTVKLDGALEAKFWPRGHLRTITHRTTGAQLIVKAADTDVLTGGKAVGTLIDETHVLGSKPKAPHIFMEIKGALGKRPDGFLIQTTTQSKDRPSGKFKAELDRARAVRDGKIQARLLPVLYELPHDIVKENGWRNRKYWPLINPNMGKSVRMQDLNEKLAEADQSGPQDIALFASQHLNVEIGMALRADNWSGAKYWAACGDNTMALEDIERRCDVAVAGMDGGGLEDLFGFCVIGREKGTRRWLVWVHAWCHRDVLEERQEIAPRLLDFDRDGDLTIVDDIMDIYREVADYVERLEAADLLPEKSAVGVDPYGIQQIIDELRRRDFDVSVETRRVEGVRQGWELQSSIISSAVQVKSGGVVHCAQPIMDWAVGNAKQEPTGNAVKITKQTAGTSKIDPLMAFFCAATLMMRNPEAMGKSYLSDNEMLVL